jgi:hypothetical protein
MKTLVLTLSLLCGDITPEIDDKFESENATQAPVPTAAEKLPRTITSAEAGQLKPRSADDVAALQKLEGKSVTVRGKVHSVYIPKSGNPVILNLGADFKTCLKAVIYDRKFRDWNLSAAEIGQLYEGKEVVAEGEISIYRDLPQLEINSPAVLRVVESAK